MNYYLISSSMNSIVYHYLLICLTRKERGQSPIFISTWSLGLESRQQRRFEDLSYSRDWANSEFHTSSFCCEVGNWNNLQNIQEQHAALACKIYQSVAPVSSLHFPTSTIKVDKRFTTQERKGWRLYLPVGFPLFLEVPSLHPFDLGSHP